MWFREAEEPDPHPADERRRESTAWGAWDDVPRDEAEDAGGLRLQLAGAAEKLAGRGPGVLERSAWHRRLALRVGLAAGPAASGLCTLAAVRSEERSCAVLATAEPLDALPLEAKAAHSELPVVAQLLTRLETLEDEPAAQAAAQPALMPQGTRRLGWLRLPEAQVAELRNSAEEPLALLPEAQLLQDE